MSSLSASASINFTELIRSTHIASNAGIPRSAMLHDRRVVYGQESATTAFDETKVIHVCRGAGTLISIVAGIVVVAAGNSTVDFDLLVNGTTVLSAAIQITSGEAAYELVAGTFSSTSLAVDDVIELDIDATVGTGTLPKGAFASVTIEENAE